MVVMCAISRVDSQQIPRNSLTDFPDSQMATIADQEPHAEDGRDAIWKETDPYANT